MDAREVQWLRKAGALSRELAVVPDRRRLLPKILDAAIELSQAERGFLVLAQPGSKGSYRIKVVEARGFDGVDFAADARMVSQHAVERALEARRGVVTTSEADKDLLDVSSVRDRRVRSIACVPLLLRDRVCGALYLDHRFAEEAFAPSDVAALEVFAGQAALALETAELRHAAPAPEPIADAPAPTREPPEGGRFGALVGRAPATLELFDAIERAARSWSPVLLRGEPGSGKDAVAAEIHARSDRSAEPFLALDCSTLDGDHLQSELFGHRRGAFPWAQRDRRGLLTLAGAGTVHLECVEGLTFVQQGALLRALRDEIVTPVGASKGQPLRCRVIASTSSDLAAEAQAGTFRADLFYRLDVLRLELPPLRARAADLPLLIDALGGADAPPRSAEALKLLAAYRWPGNLTELAGEVARWASLDVREITGRQLSDAIRQGEGLGGASPYAGKTLTEVEREMVAAALQQAQGNKARAARQLGIPRSTLYHLIERYELG